MIGNTTLTPAPFPSTGRKLAINYIPTDQLKLDPKNPRLYSRKQIRQIANSIASFGFNVPVLIDAEGTVIAGHGRVLAARELAGSEVPTIAIEHLDGAQRLAFAIADNRLTENSTWNDQFLAEQLKELSILDLDFDLEATGFDMGEIDLRIESLDKKPDALDPADQLPAIQSQAVSRLGDLWLLGRHRVVCGNALEQSPYATLTENAKAHLVFTDPPYNVPIQGHVSGLGAVQHREFPMASGEMSEGEFERFLLTCFRHLCAFSRAGSVHFICIDWRHLREFLGAGAETYGSLSNLCVWVKSNGGMGSLYRSRHELIGVYKKGKASHRNNVQLGRYGRNRTNVWTYPGTSGFGRQGEEGNLLALHPTVKPVALVVDAILECSSRGDLVLDAFLGSGTTLIAAERTGRCCRGLELDPLYADTIIRRWQAYAGEDAQHAASGQSFAQVAEARSVRS